MIVVLIGKTLKSVSVTIPEVLDQEVAVPRDRPRPRHPES